MRPSGWRRRKSSGPWIGPAGAANAALLAVSILALEDPPLRERLVAFRANQTDRVLGERLETEAATWPDLPSQK